MYLKANPTYMYLNPYTVRFSFKEEISVETAKNVSMFQQFIEQRKLPDFVECVASYHTLLVFFKKEICLSVANLLMDWQEYNLSEVENYQEIVTIPVCYDEEFAMDIERVMEYSKLTYEEVVKYHSETLYDVYLMGFLPGFAYLGMLDKRLHVPRLKVPRKRIEAGTVGIGGAQTGIYPLNSPGGWNIIGKSPVRLFDLNRDRPFTLDPSCKVKIEKICKTQYYDLIRNGL